MNKYLKLLLPSLLIIVIGLTVSCIQVVSPSGSTSEGIEVHGDWTITVSNPDGTVDSVHEFSNDLAPPNISVSGADLLTALLAGDTAITGWSIYIYGGDGIDCQEDPDPGYNGRLRDATFTRDVSEGTPLRLTTTCTMALSDTTSTTQITQVSVDAHSSPTGYPTYGSGGASSKPAAGRHRFTTKTIPGQNRVDIQHNQLVSINVVISFQSGS